MRRAFSRLTALPRPLLGCLAWLALLAAVRVWSGIGAGFPLCMLRMLTGVPCPTCGATRSLLAWSAFDLTRAMRFNPLVALVGMGLFGWLFVWLIDRGLGSNLEPRLARSVREAPWLSLILGAVGVNWMYLFFFLPK